MTAPRGFVWRGIRFAPPAAAEGEAGFYSSESISIGEDERSADWKVRQTRSAWHARLRIGADRYPGVGATREEALEQALIEAALVATYIVAMLPSRGVDVSLEPLRAKRPAPRSKRPRRAIKVSR